jgi:hypothetical protein
MLYYIINRYTCKASYHSFMIHIKFNTSCQVYHIDYNYF